MRVVVTGAGAVGRHLAADLAERGHDVTLIEQDPDVVSKVRGWAPGVTVILGDGCEPSVLESADFSTAEVVVAALGPLDRGRQLRHWDELGELPEVLSGGGEEEFILGRPWDLVTASDRASGCI